MKAPENNRKSLESIFLASILNLCIAVFFVSAVGCGNWPVGRESVAKKQYWEGVGIWGQPAETAPLSVVSGWVRDTPGLTTKIGGAVWTVESVEDISKGLARVWPSVDYRWVVIRMRIEYDTPVTERVPYNLKKLVLGESISMEDDDGYKHFPCQVHLRLVPNIFKIIELDTDGITVPLIFPLKRGLKPVSVEIHDPLNSGKLTWWHPGEPSDWYSIDKNIEIASQGMRRLWEIHLDKVLYEQSPPSSDFKTKLSFRNITFDTLPSPNLALARLYLGSGKTLLSSDTPQITEVDPGKAVERILTFNNVPEHESIDVVVPYRNHWAR
ncbi:MAG: hypothetical protein JKX97_01190, partial [Candidatus Lindowbacteria bacterium]|nr:hypothetical protein [Candidatus Lindowbacteria bacterium]